MELIERLNYFRGYLERNGELPGLQDRLEEAIATIRQNEAKLKNAEALARAARRLVKDAAPWGSSDGIVTISATRLDLLDVAEFKFRETP